MFGFGKKKESPQRRAFREEFETTTTRLHGAAEVLLITIGHTINLANSLFLQSSGHLRHFSVYPPTTRTLTSKSRQQRRSSCAANGVTSRLLWASVFSRCGLVQ